MSTYWGKCVRPEEFSRFETAASVTGRAGTPVDGSMGRLHGQVVDGRKILCGSCCEVGSQSLKLQALQVPLDTPCFVTCTRHRVCGAVVEAYLSAVMHDVHERDHCTALGPCQQ